MNDPIYYVTVNDTVLTDRIFESYDDAKRFAIYERGEEIPHEKYVELHRAYMKALESYQTLFNAFSNLDEIPDWMRKSNGIIRTW